jgi:hypothetical protein
LTQLQPLSVIIAPYILGLQEAGKRLFGRWGLLDLEGLARSHGLVALPLPGDRPAHGWRCDMLSLRVHDLDDVHHINLPGLEHRGALIADLYHDQRSGLSASRGSA